MMAPPDQTQITRGWPIDGPLALERPGRGTNSDVWRVSGDGGTWMLRRIGDERRWSREHAIRTALHGAALPFAVPRTIATCGGSPMARIDTGLYELTELIPGRAPTSGHRGDAFASGTALAILDLALARIQHPPPAAASDDGSAFADRARLSAAFPNHPDVPAASEILQRVERDWSNIVQRLPHQLVHADPYPSNMLMVDGRVSGILDFEFCSVDARVTDLAAALSAFALQNPERDDPWSIITALTDGYLGHVPLSRVEIAAIPLAIIRREALSLTHWTGLIERGQREAIDQTWRSTKLLQVEAWITANAARLIGMLDALCTRKRSWIEPKSKL